MPVAGILDILDNYAFVRTSGYLPGPNDVYVSLAQVRKHGLRKGDAVTGAVRQPQRGRAAADKFNALVRLDTVNGARPRAAARPRRVQQADAALPAGPAAARDRAEQPDDPGHRPGRADRQGPARPHRLPAQGRQDDGAAGDRQRDHREQPRGPPHGRARRRAARGGHRHAAHGQGRGHRLDLRPSGRGPHHGRRAGHRAGQAAGRARPRRGRAARLDHPAGRAYNLAAPASGRILSGGVDSTRALPAEAVLRCGPQHRARRLADRSSPPRWSRPARRWTR